MIAIIDEAIRAYPNQARRHETIALFLPVQTRTGWSWSSSPTRADSEIFVQN